MYYVFLYVCFELFVRNFLLQILLVYEITGIVYLQACIWYS